MKKSYHVKKYPTIGACGLDCGLCPRYYTAGPSRCPGCAGPDFVNKHPSCSFITCCVKKKNLEVCGECFEFPCTKFKTAEEYNIVKENPSYPSCKKILQNLYSIKEQGLDNFIELQRYRIRLLKIMINNFDDGRSKSFYCRAANFIDLTDLAESIEEARKIIKQKRVLQNDMKTKAGILKKILNDIPTKN
jgi:hypothetical protein